MVHPNVLLALVLSTSLVWGCNSSGDVDPPPGTPDAGEQVTECEDYVCLDLPVQGFQIKNVGVEILPQEDVEYCETLVLPGSPGEVYYVSGFESKMTLGSHHLIVSAAEVGSATEAEMTVGELYRCVGARGNDLTGVTGQQLPYHQESFPPGVGKIFYGGQKVVFNFHYLNTGDSTVWAQAVVNFVTTDEASIQKIAKSFGFFNLGINTPVGQSRSFTTTCMFNEDIMVHKLVRHTHQWGTEFPVSYAGGSKDGELIYISPSYEEPDYIFPEPVLLEAGTGFTFTCNYTNTSDSALGFGVKATDEMCILFGDFYKAADGMIANDEGCVTF